MGLNQGKTKERRTAMVKFMDYRLDTDDFIKVAYWAHMDYSCRLSEYARTHSKAEYLAYYTEIRRRALRAARQNKYVVGAMLTQISQEVVAHAYGFLTHDEKKAMLKAKAIVASQWSPNPFASMKD
jgi:hypothetical protein